MNLEQFRTKEQQQISDYFNGLKDYSLTDLYYYNTLSRVITDGYMKFTLFSGSITRGIRRDDGVKTRQSMNRAFNKIHELIYLNMNLEQMAFVTLTFKENIIDYDIASQRFKYFIKKYRSIHKDLKYLAVWEHQEKRGKKNNDIGAIHYHLIIFNYDNSDISKLWTYGFSNVKLIDRFENFNAIGNYLGAYLSKQPVSFNRRMYFTSRNLKRNRKKEIGLDYLKLVESQSDFNYNIGNNIKVYLIGLNKGEKLK